MLTGTPVRVEMECAGRKRPGLMRAHLTAVAAAAEVCGDTVSGDAMGSSVIEVSS